MRAVKNAPKHKNDVKSLRKGNNFCSLLSDFSIYLWSAFHSMNCISKSSSFNNSLYDANPLTGTSFTQTKDYLFQIRGINFQKRVVFQSFSASYFLGFLLRISAVSVTKPTGNCGFGHIYWRNP